VQLKKVHPKSVRLITDVGRPFQSRIVLACGGHSMDLQLWEGLRVVAARPCNLRA